LISSLANNVVQAAPSVSPSTLTISQPGAIKFKTDFKLYFS
jgi:hypothetical protein